MRAYDHDDAMTDVVELARAKINLTLKVLGRRIDGYHNLFSLVSFADAGDGLRLIVGAEPGVTVTGPFAGAITGENLVAGALHLLGDVEPRLRLGHVELDKQLPVAAGIGGGSADAAALLRAVRSANPGLCDQVDWLDLARRLGADVTVCFTNRPIWMSGAGETLHELAVPLPPLAAVLVNPLAAVPPDKSARVFRLLGAPALKAADAPTVAARPAIPDRAELLALMARTGNDLEGPATAIVPQIEEVLDKLEASAGIELARLSGAGPTCFGIFVDRAMADAAAEQIRSSRPQWWIRSATIG